MGEARAAGFDHRINCDLIYAVPGLGDTRWRRTLERVIATGPTHVSCYELTVEPGTPLHTSVRRGLVTPVDGARSMRQHRIAVELLEAAGYAQYEVSNFAVPGEESQDNLVYWHNGYIPRRLAWSRTDTCRLSAARSSSASEMGRHRHRLGPLLARARDRRAWARRSAT